MNINEKSIRVNENQWGISKKIMKYISIIPLVIFTTLLAKDNTAYVKVDGMMCGYSCAGKVSKVVQDLKGVKEYDVDNIVAIQKIFGGPIRDTPPQINNQGDKLLQNLDMILMILVFGGLHFI